MSDYKFEGWVAKDASAADGNLAWEEFEPKRWEETDIDIQVTHSGICGTDLHIMRSKWFPVEYPLVVGHEIVGVAVRVGREAEGNVEVGDVVGVGGQADSCLQRYGQCEACEGHNENYCSRHFVQTYASRHVNGDKAQGGHARYHRAPSHFVFKIPPGLEPQFAAPMLCGGVTVFAPLKQYGVGPGKSVGVIGIGGLGHFAILFAKAMGATKIVGISRNETKKADALQLGADDLIATEENDEWAQKWSGSFDIIINTTSSPKMPFDQFVNLLKPKGTLVMLGAPVEPLPLNVFSLLMSGRRVASSLVGSPDNIREMLQLAVDKQIKPWIEERPMKEANQAMLDMEANKARFRYVLTNRG